nr:class I SAM-dependent methyltransferase [Tessaracoccus coleopterorum]
MDFSSRTAAVAALFDRIADQYDNAGFPFFGPIARHLVDALRPLPGEAAADLGCGRGEVTSLLADAVTPGQRHGPRHQPCDGAARPRGVDRHRCPRRGGRRVGPALPPGSFDVVASSLVLFFLPDPPGALGRWVGLLRPGGRIGVTTFGAQSDLWQRLDGLLRPWMPPQDPRTAGPDSPFASDAGMEATLAAAGARDAVTQTFRVQVRFRRVEDWVRFTRSVGQRAAWDSMPEEEVERVTSAAAHLLGRSGRRMRCGRTCASRSAGGRPAQQQALPGRGRPGSGRNGWGQGLRH